MSLSALPWTYEPRPDSRVSNIRLGTWLFLSSEAMLFGSLFSAYVLLRTGAQTWPDSRALVTFAHAALPTLFLVLATSLVRRKPVFAAVFGVLFLLVKATDYAGLWSAGVRPAQNLMVASWYAMTGLHWVHVAGGTIAAAWLALTAWRVPSAHHIERVRALTMYWLFVDLVWLGILACFWFS